MTVAPSGRMWVILVVVMTASGVRWLVRRLWALPEGRFKAVAASLIFRLEVLGRPYEGALPAVDESCRLAAAVSTWLEVKMCRPLVLNGTK